MYHIGPGFLGVNNSQAFWTLLFLVLDSPLCFRWRFLGSGDFISSFTSFSLGQKDGPVVNRQVLLNLKECDKFYFSCKCCFLGQEYFFWTSYLFWTSATSIGQVLPLLARCYLYWSSVTSLSGKRYCYWTCATATSIGQVFPLYWTSATAIGHVLPLLVKCYFYRTSATY